LRFEPIASAADPREGIAGVTPPLSTRPFKVALGAQAATTIVIAIVAGAWAGRDAALSAVLGGTINLVAEVLYGLTIGIVNPSTPSGTVFALLRAEASKVALIVFQLWLVLTMYQELAALPFIVAFVLTVLVFRLAFIVRD
jgi:F0F1-type ATP synthase assembly protein I